MLQATCCQLLPWCKAGLTELTGNFGQERGEKVGRSRMIDESTITGNSQLVLNSEVAGGIFLMESSHSESTCKFQRKLLFF
jgi:hypothetical protein